MQQKRQKCGNYYGQFQGGQFQAGNFQIGAHGLFQICQKRRQLVMEAVIKYQQRHGFHQLALRRQCGRRAAAQLRQTPELRHLAGGS